jgi:short-subunit dehydrogenase
MAESVLIVGAGVGLSASIARKCFDSGMHVTLAARNIEKIKQIAKETKAAVFACDASEPDQVKELFKLQDGFGRSLDLVVYNPSARVRGPIHELDIKQTKKALEITSFGAFLVAQQASQRMLQQGHGSIFFTGASAGVKGFANSSVFAMGKFGLRGLAQALARELHPKNIHIGHFIIDGGITSVPEGGNDNYLNADSIADTYLQFHRQNRSAWSWEVEVRPWVETF